MSAKKRVRVDGVGLVQAVPTPVPVLDDVALAALRKDLEAWTFDTAEAVLGVGAQSALMREYRVMALMAARDASRIGAIPGNMSGLDTETHRRVALLSRLFLLGDELTWDEASAALPNLGAEQAAAVGLVHLAGRKKKRKDKQAAEGADKGTTASLGSDGTRVRAMVEIRPVEGSWLLSDLGQIATGEPLRADHVLGAGGASYALARLVVRRPVGRVLDVGAGGGIQTLLASRHADYVVATDISKRALAMADISLRLAGLRAGEDYELRLGSMLEPAAGEQYDLVVSNPPFVITPDTVRDMTTREGALGLMEYRDAGRAGDELVADLTRDVADPERGVLAPGGIAQFLGNWEITEGVDWRDRVASWVPDGVDAWVVQREVMDPAAYVETWLRDGGMTPCADRAGFEAAYEHWVLDFVRRGVVGIGMGTVTLHRPAVPLGADQPAWRRLEHITTKALSPGAADVLGRHVGEALDVVDALRALGVDPNVGNPIVRRPDGEVAPRAGLTDDAVAALAGLRLKVSPDVTEERHYRPGSADPNLVTLHQGGAYGRNRQVGTLTAALVGASDGELTVGQIANAVAALLDVDADQAVRELAEDSVALLIEGFVSIV